MSKFLDQDLQKPNHCNLSRSLVNFLKIGAGSGLTCVIQTAPYRSRGVQTIHDFPRSTIISMIICVVDPRPRTLCIFSFYVSMVFLINTKNDP
jgi:hypothetical protein